MNCLRLHIMILFMFLLVSPAYIALGGILNANVDLSPDIIFHNGDIITMEQSPSQVEAIAINEETIIAIGDESQILNMANSDFLDITTTPTPFPSLFLVAVVISIVTLVILVAFGKKLTNNNHRMNECCQVSKTEQMTSL